MTEQPGIKAHIVALRENDSYTAYLHADNLDGMPARPGDIYTE